MTGRCQTELMGAVGAQRSRELLPKASRGKTAQRHGGGPEDIGMLQYRLGLATTNL